MTQKPGANAAVTNGGTHFTRACPSDECRQARCSPLKEADIEMLACLAARLAGRDPDRLVTIELGGEVAFEDVMWRYPDFLDRAEAAYRVLAAGDHPATNPLT